MPTTRAHPAVSTQPSRPSPKPVSILFVCLGNICRSTMAEAALRHASRFGTEHQHPLIANVDSCGTGAYHAGAPPDSRTLAVLADNGIITYRHRARRVRVPEDFVEFDYVLAMDRDNEMDLTDMVKRAARRGLLSGDELGKIYLYGTFAGAGREGEEIDDPYYGGKEGFNIAWEQVNRLGKGLIKHIEEGGPTGEGASSIS